LSVFSKNKKKKSEPRINTDCCEKKKQIRNPNIEIRNNIECSKFKFSKEKQKKEKWIPAFAGMTKETEIEIEKTWARCPRNTWAGRPCYEKRNLLPSYLFSAVFAFTDYCKLITDYFCKKKFVLFVFYSCHSCSAVFCCFFSYSQKTIFRL